MNLYWVNNAIYKLYDEFVDPDTGEISDPDEFAARYAALDISREEIIENTLLMYKNCIADAAAIADEIKVLKERKSARQSALRRTQPTHSAARSSRPRRSRSHGARARRQRWTRACVPPSTS